MDDSNWCSCSSCCCVFCYLWMRWCCITLYLNNILKPSIISGAFYFYEELRGVGVSEPLGEERYKKGYTHSSIIFVNLFVYFTKFLLPI